ncbi:MAG: T9SS type A sorting domain-containing protein, partial [Candidatus Marinimicrobia bacterium]|nr:T9SS type A sorting domain-containing protein [Candidatus Neomarinimicrobiota bacterium]
TSKEFDANINKFRLYPCYPNPFNPSTNIRISLPETAPVKLQVYNLNGELVRTLLNTSLSAGEYSFTWSGRDHQNRLVGTGIYLLQISGDRGFSRTQKVIFLR